MLRAPYPTDLTDAQWARVALLLPPPKPGGRPRDVELREVVNAALYRHHGGCSWRLLPHAFPPWQTVYTYVRQWQHDGTWARLLDAVGRPSAPPTQEREPAPDDAPAPRGGGGRRTAAPGGSLDGTW